MRSVCKELSCQSHLEGFNLTSQVKLIIPQKSQWRELKNQHGSNKKSFWYLEFWSIQGIKNCISSRANTSITYSTYLSLQHVKPPICWHWVLKSSLQASPARWRPRPPTRGIHFTPPSGSTSTSPPPNQPVSRAAGLNRQILIVSWEICHEFPQTSPAGKPRSAKRSRLLCSPACNPVCLLYNH